MPFNCYDETSFTEKCRCRYFGICWYVIDNNKCEATGIIFNHSQFSQFKKFIFRDQEKFGSWVLWNLTSPLRFQLQLIGLVTGLRLETVINTWVSLYTFTLQFSSCHIPHCCIPAFYPSQNSAVQHHVWMLLL